VQLYLHVPFCARRCSYCDFAIAVRRSVPSAVYADAVLTEWQAVRGPWADEGPLETIYFGGGTPSRLAPAEIERLIDCLGADQGLVPEVEVTLEANPEDVSPEAARAWRAAGVTRVSLGVQSFSPAVLQWMHRTHDADAAVRAVGALRDEGLQNVSLDLIYGLPVELGRSWEADLVRALELSPSHVSLYGLTVETGTPLGRWVERGRSLPAEDSVAAREYLLAHELLAERGFRHYEVSNAGLPGFESRHNLGYWSRRPFLGLGPSAHSARANRRWWNLREWEGYRRQIEAGVPVVAGEESLTSEQQRLEEIYLGLRTDLGIAASSLPPDRIDEWVAAEWASRRDSRVVLSPEGWLRLDALVARV
jgi:oxygen-independent coproporphyrinogen-3 oxidase